MQYENEKSFLPVGYFNVKYLDQIKKRNDDKRQLKIIRLKKDDPISTNKRSLEESGVASESGIRSQKQSVQDDSMIHSDISDLINSPGWNRYHLDDENQSIMNKRALKILRLKKNVQPDDESMMPSFKKLKTLNPIYLRHFNPNKRALKIIRLKKNQKPENEPITKYLTFNNPSKQFWNRFGRSNSDRFGRTVREEQSLGRHENTESPMDEAINLYSRFY